MLWTIVRWVVCIAIVLWIVKNPAQAAGDVKTWIDAGGTFLTNL